MAVLEVSETFDSRGGSVDEDGVVTLSRIFQVETSDPINDNEAVVTAALPVALYDPHPAYARAIARTIDVKPEGSSALWRVTVGYSSKPFRAYNGAPPTEINTASPTKPSAAQNNSTAANLRLPQFSFSRKEILEARQFDADGNPTRNSAGDLFEGLMFHRDVLVVGIKYWSIKLTVAHILSYWNTVNQSAWYGFPAESLLVREFNFRSVYETMTDAGATFLAMMYECDIQLEYRPPVSLAVDPNGQSWQLHVQDRGLRQLVNGKLEPCLSSDGSPVTEPVPLAADGTQALPGSGILYKHFRMFPRKDFNPGGPGNPGLFL